MNSNFKPQLWNANLPLRFAPVPAPVTREAEPLYPRLDMARFFQTAVHDNNDGAHTELNKLSEVGETPEAQNEAQSFVINLPLREDTVVSPTDPFSQKTLELPKGQDTTIVLPPSTELAYQICPEKFNNARRSRPGSPASFWSYNMYNKGEPEAGTTRNVKVHYCKSKHSTEEVCKRYFLGSDVIGFDLEWKAGVRSGSGDARDHVSLIQIANEAHVGLFHVAVFPKDDFVAPTFRQIMEDPAVSKAGVNIKGDCTRLRNYLGIDTRGIFELSHLYKVVKHSRERTPSLVDKRVVSLAKQVEDVLRLPLYKGLSVRTSNWALTLNSQQIAYSASDAYAGFQLYHVLEKERQNLDPTPPRPFHAELNKPLELAISDDEDLASDGEKQLSPDEIASFETGQKDVGSGSRAPKAASSNHGPGYSRSSAKIPVSSVDKRLVAAELKMQNYRVARRAMKGGVVHASPSALRAYYVWHCNIDLKPEDIAKLARTPPLMTNTITGYILDAVTSEKLPYDKQRMTTEVLPLLRPATLALGKYQPLLQVCGYPAGPASPSPAGQ